MIERNHVKKVITKYKVDQTALQWLRKEKVVVEVEMRSLKMAYDLLKESLQDVVLQLGFVKKKLRTTYNEIDALKQRVLKEKVTQDVLKTKVLVAKKEVHSSRMQLEALKNSSRELFLGSAAFSKMIEDKIFLAMFNKYFFN
jgi:arsenate reductase-like glutaredoxin family protein